MRFKKKILSPNTYRVGGEDVELDSGRFRKWVNNFRKLKKDGYRLPAPFYHDEKAVPVRLGATKKDVDAYNNGGFWERLWVAKKDGALWGEIDVPDPDKAKKLTTGEIKEVSPAIRETFETAESKTLNDVVTHIAMVTQPVAGAQEPFLAASHQLFGRSQEVSESGGSWDFQATNDIETIPENLNASTATLDDVIEVLAEMGLVLPVDTVENNFAERVTTAALAVRGAGKGRMKEQKTPPHQTVTYSKDLEEEPDMADEEKEVVETPEQVELARKYEATKKFAEQVATESLQKRIVDLNLSQEYMAKHISPLLETHDLQFSQDGNVIPGTLDIVLDAIEGMPKPEAAGTFNPFLMSRMVEKGTVEEPPADPKTAPKTDQEVDELLRTMPAFSSRMAP